ncbi:uncharacterized protein LOC143563627 isoform X1 [Bidens hawaiensis]|uniref:uncharacterized protein LOC143563627 isoform X1 n=1 Tax=Bidens hawaiensis TaxID=980011 RepID=UPI004049D692
MSSFISNIKSAASGAVGNDKTTNPDQQSNTGLLSSAKLVAEAAQSAANNQTDQIDKPKVAGAAGDLLDSVKQYGKFDESQGVGQYINQADEYLHQYEKSSGVADTKTATPLDETSLSGKSAAPLEEKKAEVPLPVEEEKTEVPLPVEGEEKAEVPLPVEEEKVKVPLPIEEKGEKDEFESAVGAGDALKAAGSFFK